jgi:hypothetical protein
MVTECETYYIIFSLGFVLQRMEFELVKNVCRGKENPRWQPRYNNPCGDRRWPRALIVRQGAWIIGAKAGFGAEHG